MKIMNYKIKFLLNKFNSNLNESILIYKVDKDNTQIKLFGEEFVKNNIDN